MSALFSRKTSNCIKNRSVMLITDRYNELYSEFSPATSLWGLETQIYYNFSYLLKSFVSNDLHYGASHSNYWGTFNSDVCRAMMRKYLARIIKIAETHNSENCIVWENGDVISGSIHRSIQITNKENVIEQIMGASELIAEFIAELSKHFKTVKFAAKLLRFCAKITSVSLLRRRKLYCIFPMISEIKATSQSRSPIKACYSR